jgi:hypothetical protein
VRFFEKPVFLHSECSNTMISAASYAKIPHLDFLDLGWGGDVAVLHQHRPRGQRRQDHDDLGHPEMR